jgi:hypothetical protein
MSAARVRPGVGNPTAENRRVTCWTLDRTRPSKPSGSRACLLPAQPSSQLSAQFIASLRRHLYLLTTSP